jgi:cytochrome c-type biogenesis protein CcmH/NrfG
MAARVAVALVAVVALGWLAVMERDVRLQASAVRASGRLAVPGNAARAEAAFRDARLLNPDTAPDLGLALLRQGRGQRPEATALLSDVVRREPDNVTAWALLYSVTRGPDRATARRALAARARLDPLAARRR